MQITIDFLQSGMDGTQFLIDFGELKGDIKALHASIDALNKRLTPIEQMTKEHEALRNRGFGVLACLGVCGGAIAYGFDLILKRLF